MFEIKSFIIICCFGLIIIGKFISILWRIFYDNQLSIILYKLEKIYKKLIRLNLIGSIKTKINWYWIVGIIVNIIANITNPVLFWMTTSTPETQIILNEVILIINT